MSRAIAIIEVLAAFALTHVTYRALKHFTFIGAWEHAAGTNLTPGLVLIGFTLTVLLICRRSFASYGLSAKQWPYYVALGLAGSLIMLACDSIGLLLTRVQFDATRPADPDARISPLRLATLAAVVLPGYAGILTMVQKRRPILDSISPWITIPAITALAAILPLAAAYFHRPPTWLTAVWLFFGAGVGEEVFYRGYIQSRVDLAWGRPWQLCGFQFGMGLIVASLLFGLVHALNTVDYFHGRFDFNWSMGLQSVVVGIFFGLIRAKTDSVIPGAVIHGLSDIFAFTASIWR